MQKKADAILAEGFRDAQGSYGTRQIHRGVWVTIGEPWDQGIADAGDALLVIELPEAAILEGEWIEERKGYRERARRRTEPLPRLRGLGMRRVRQDRPQGVGGLEAVPHRVVGL